VRNQPPLAAASATPWIVAFLSPIVLGPLWLLIVPEQSAWLSPLRGLSGLILVLLLATATVTDLSKRRIRNWTTYPAIAYAVGLNLFGSIARTNGWRDLQAHCGGIGIQDAILGGILCFSGAFTAFLLFGGGAGDVKLMAALGCFVGWQAGAQIWLCTMLFAAIFALVYAGCMTSLHSLLGFFANGLGHAGAMVQARLGNAGSDVIATLHTHLPMAPFYTLATLIVLGIPVLWPGETFVSLGTGWSW